MSVRGQEDLKLALIKTFTVAASSTSTPGMPQTLTAENTCRDSTAGEDSFGVAYVSMGNGSPAGAAASAGQQIQVIMGNSPAIVKVKVGTAGSTVDLWQVVGTTGVTDAVTPGGGTTVQYLVGRALQSGVSGDMIGMAIHCMPSVHA